MTMAGPTGHEWLAAVLHSAKYDAVTQTVTADVDDWGNLVSLARQALKIPPDATDNGDVLRNGLAYRQRSVR